MHHRTSNFGNRISNTTVYKRNEKFVNLLLEFIFSSLIRSHDLEWVSLKSNVKHRFGSILFPIDDLLKWWPIIDEFVTEIEKETREHATYECKLSTFNKQREPWKKQKQIVELQKDSAQQPFLEAKRLLQGKLFFRVSRDSFVNFPTSDP